MNLAMDSRESVLDRPFICTHPGCDKAFTRAFILKNHVEAKHEQVRHFCPDCPQKFQRKNDLRQHRSRVHEGIRRFACVRDSRNASDCACGQRFASRSELNRHQRKGKTKANSLSPQALVAATSGTVYHAPSQYPSTAALDTFLIAIRTYFTGSFEAKTWVSRNSDEPCIHTKLSSDCEGFYLTMTVQQAVDLLRQGEYKPAGLHLSRACRFARSLTRSEPMYLIQDMLRIALLGGTSEMLVRKSVEKVIQHFYKMAEAVHGRRHPVTTIIRSTLQYFGGEQFQLAFVAAQCVIQGCLDVALGTYHMESLLFRIVDIKADISGSKKSSTNTAEVLALLSDCDALFGQGSWQSRFCYGALLGLLRLPEEWARMEHVLEKLQLRIQRLEYGRKRSSWEMMMWIRTESMYYTVGRYAEAAEVIEKHLLPLHIELFGEISAHVIKTVTILEMCYTYLENHDRSEEVRIYRRRLLDQIEEGEREAEAIEAAALAAAGIVHDETEEDNNEQDVDCSSTV